MTVFAYLYTHPLLESAPPDDLWGAEVVRVYRDFGGDESQSGQSRPQLQQLLQDCAGGTVAEVRVRRWAELGNSPDAIAPIVTQLQEQGIQLTSLAEGPFPEGDVVAVVAATAAIAQQQRRDSLRLGHARNRVKAQPPPGRAPYGYRRGKDRYTLDRAAAPVVKDFFEQFLLFGSLRGAVRYLAKTYGKRISASTGQRWLSHPVYRGDLLYQDGRVVRDTHTPILGRDEAAQVDRLLRRNRRLPPRTASAQRSLAGLVQCQECGSTLRVAPVSRPRRDQTYLYLRPSACPRAKPCGAIPYDAVLESTIATVCRDLPPAIATQPLPPIGAIQAGIQRQIAAKQDSLAQLPPLVAAGVLDETTADLRAYTLRSDIAALEQQRSQLPPENLPEIAQTLSIPQFWYDLSEAERRVYLREFIRQVELVREGQDWSVAIKFVF
ncbi:recombinase family protein [Leptolyngbya sp. PCC 6406]|uniref:recombinase family protein n=2 Tax=Leptolyngbya sp. PCC 6406 TaxID=1173264 RepID=UPI0002ABF941|nr:recombinase family protein [Leptolyngbya sp. PCC 6406]